MKRGNTIPLKERGQTQDKKGRMTSKRTLEDVKTIKRMKKEGKPIYQIANTIVAMHEGRLSHRTAYSWIRQL